MIREWSKHNGETLQETGREVSFFFSHFPSELREYEM